MSIYWKTPTGHGFSEDESGVPDTAVRITEDEYNGIIAAEQTALDEARAALLRGASERWTTVHDDLVSAGVSEAAATLLAGTVGVPPDQRAG